MRSFFTSSIDKIDPPTPFVNALDWDSYRNQFQKHQSLHSGNRNCALASSSLNPESAALSNRSGRGEDFPLIVQNSFGRQITIEIHPEPVALAAWDVDACFVEGSIDFLMDKNTRSSWLETPLAVSDETYDQELGLLESVQEIAISLARTTPTRTISVKQDVGSWTASTVD